MRLTKRYVAALDAAQRRMFHCDFCGYLDMRELLTRKDRRSRLHFRERFTTYYGLNVGGLSDEFKDRYFALMFRGRGSTGGPPHIAGLLRELSQFPRRSGTTGMPFSFASKLVAMRDESSPIFDRHVAAFFDVKLPGTKSAPEERIARFVEILGEVAADCCSAVVMSPR